MNILALDPATKCGWAFAASNGGTIFGGVWDFSTRRDESRGMRLYRLRGKLEEMNRTTGIGLLVFEAARHAAPKMQGALVSQAEMQGVIKEFCEEREIDYRGYSPSEIKKHATGKGNANKVAVGAAARAKFPDVEIEDDNHADALMLLDLARRDVGMVVT